MNTVKKDVLTLLEFSSEELNALILSARELKRNRLVSDPKVFANKTSVLIFEKPSLRTRISFEAAINELGGHAISLTSEMVGMGKRESVEDVARNLDRMVHLIVARTFSHDTIERLAHYCSIPVINALTDTHHPCQALAFAQTLMEHSVAFKEANVVFIGDGNNVCNSLMVLAAKLGYGFTAVTPKGYEPEKDIFTQCSEIARKNGSRIELTNDIIGAVRDATVIYTDVWTSMGQEKETEKRKKDFTGFQINSALLAKAPSQVLVTHCLPAHRGEEITSDVLDSDHSIAFDEAENRLHVQKAIIVHLFSNHD
jgi:ornithine carbamoyltransferase